MRRDSATELARHLASTNSIQSRASDPAASAWVAANAGTGKTHVLTQRVLRILLGGTSPERILCLTYTKAAAAEMSTRVFGELGTWVTAEPEVLAKALAVLLARAASDAEMERARTLFAKAIETPGGLKVQTIHAFCEQLLQRFPLEAGVPPGFEVLDDEAVAVLRRGAIDEVLAIAAGDPTSRLGKALSTAIAYAVDDNFDEKLALALGHRDWIEAAQRLEEAADDPFAAAEALLGSAFGVRKDASRDGLQAESAGLLSDDELRRLKGILAQGSANDIKAGEAIGRVRTAATPALRCEALAGLLLTKDGEPRKSLVTKSTDKANPGTEALLVRLQGRFVELYAEMRALDLVTATMALLRLADAVLSRYTEAKVRRAGLDFEDLIARTSSLLRTRNATEWVLYKLDGGLDHILVDESQDTSPQQWSIIESLAQEFYVGRGQHDVMRTVFAVGDEKQSIYSFQGAAPEKFAAMGLRFAGMAEKAAQSFATLPLTLSFRSVAPLLEAVDRVFADPLRTPGVGSPGKAIGHIAKRAGQAGLVEIWPPEVWQDAEASDAWSPLDEASMSTPAARLADRIARTIKRWLDGGERLPSQNRLVRAGDILILVRRRRPFAPQMVAALKSIGVAVAGADRMQTMEQIAVADLVALGEFLVLPEDDLALAAVLKSPLIGLDDDDLIAIAPERRGTLWSALLDAAPRAPRWLAAAEQLKRWRRRADLSPPFEFFAALLDRDGGREKLLSRLGPEAADPIDEFLNLALAYDEREPPSLVGFLDWLRRSEREIKRDMEHGRDEVRVMTVHGAKGLEAPIVFLPDTCGQPGGRTARLLRLDNVDRQVGVPPPFIWPVKGSKGLEVVEGARAAIAGKEREEDHRLLYVAMTRARDRLYVAGFEGKKRPLAGCWYNLIGEGLKDVVVPAEGTDGGQVLRYEAMQIAACEPPNVELADDARPEAPPDWARRQAPSEPHLAVPVAPSRFVPYEVDTEGEPAEAAATRPDRAPPESSPLMLSSDNRFLRGTITHALLEHLPGFPQADWRRAAEAFTAARGPGLTARQRASIVDETLAVLETPELRALYGPQSRAEVPIAARIASPDGRKPHLFITGQIDRLARVGDDVLIIDYKTNRPPPVRTTDVAEAYLYQLAAYRLAVQQIFPGSAVRAAILWTDGPVMMPIPADVLDQRQSRLWDMHPAWLDADTAPS